MDQIDNMSAHVLVECQASTVRQARSENGGVGSIVREGADEGLTDYNGDIE